MKVKPGQLLCLDSGSYSNYEVAGFFVVLREFDPLTELQTHLDANPAQRIDYRFERASFLAALLAKGLLLEIVYGTLYLGEFRSSDVSLTLPTQA